MGEAKLGTAVITPVLFYDLQWYERDLRGLIRELGVELQLSGLDLSTPDS